MDSSSANEKAEWRADHHPEWHINRAIAALQQSKLLSTKYGELITEICDILKHWSAQWAGKREWSSFCNYRGFLHEVEEALVPLSNIIDSFKSANSCKGSDMIQPSTVFDICCGKGMFGMLLSAISFREPFIRDNIRRIVLVDKQKHIRWDHIDRANELISSKGNGFSIPITIWKGVNIFDSEFEYSLRHVESPNHVIMIGIHLCRRLSSRFVELVNRMEDGRVQLAILAPCCLPRLSESHKNANGVITIPRVSVPDEDCKSSAQLVKANEASLHKIYKTCWRCGIEGHSRESCSVAEGIDLKLNPKKLLKKMSKQKQCEIILQSSHCGAPVALSITDLTSMPNPFIGWCDFLLFSLNEKRGSKMMIDIDLDVSVAHDIRRSSNDTHRDCSCGNIVSPAVVEGDGWSSDEEKLGDKDCELPLKKIKRDDNWNAERKLTWIIATSMHSDIATQAAARCDAK